MGGILCCAYLLKRKQQQEASADATADAAGRYGV